MGIDFSFTGGIFGKFPRENFNIFCGTFLEMFGLFHGHIFSYGHFFCFSTFLQGYDFFFVMGKKNCVKIALSPCKCKQLTHVKMYLVHARKIENIPFKKVKI